MALQTSGAISISQIRTELGSSSGSLRTLSSLAGKSTPDAMSEFYGYSSGPTNDYAYQYAHPGMYQKSMYNRNYGLRFIDVNNDFSVSFWYKMDDSTSYGFSASHVGYVFCVSDGANGFSNTHNSFYVRKQSTSGLYVSFSGSAYSGAYIKTSSVFGQWFFVLLTYKASTKQLKMYVNGSTTPVTINITTTQSPATTERYLTVGNQTFTSANVWPGAIDDLAFYSSTLSDADSATLYNSGNPYDIAQISSMFNWYRFENNINSEGLEDLTTNASSVNYSSSY